MNYQASKESVSKHKVPKWYNDVKFGIFIHWGLYSVPAFAVTGRSFIESINKDDHFANNPYAEWYLNSLRVEGCPTQKYLCSRKSMGFSNLFFQNNTFHKIIQIFIIFSGLFIKN